MKLAFAATLMAISLGATAQTPQAVSDEPVKKPVAKKVDTKKKLEAKKPVAKKPAPKKADLPKTAPEVRVYRNSADAPTLRDKSGNVIPTNPNDYDVSSAMGRKK